MTLLISERIRRHRMEHNLTQDALAQVLGVSPQSVSKWECEDGYPDITLLPAIANFLEISVDELIGCDEITIQSDIQKNYLDRIGTLDEDEWLELSLAYHHKYPRNWQIATLLMQHIVSNCRDLIDAFKPYLYSLCERILSDCSDAVYRKSAVHYVCMICPEDEVDSYLKRISEVTDEERLSVWEDRFWFEQNLTSYRAYRFAGNFLSAVHTVVRLYIRPNESTSPEDAAAWYESVLQMLNGLTNNVNGEIPDGWIGEYYYATLRLSAALFGGGDKERGYIFLEKALQYTKQWSGIPDGTLLSLGNPLVYGNTKIVKGKPVMVLENGKETSFLYAGYYSIQSLDSVMTASSGWEWFDSVRDEERWKEIRNTIKNEPDERDTTK